MKKALPELPWQKRERYGKDFGIKENDIELYVSDPILSAYFESVVEGKGAVFAQTASNYLSSDLVGLLKKDLEAQLPSQEHFRQLMDMVMSGKVTSRGAKDILGVIVKNQEVGPSAIAENEGLLQQNNEDDLKPIVAQVIADNGAMITQYKEGKEAVLQALVGMVMKMTKGSANPAVTAKLLKEMM
jgi:aspartyl-tRNA(Asn)/glutamyl-tRNA(Gln) amidotransferase subunit B